MFKFNNTKRIIRLIKLSKQAFGNYKKSILALTVLGFLSGLLEAVGVNAIIPVFSIVSGDGSEPNDFISKSIIDFFSFLNLDFRLRYVLGFIVFLFILKAIVLFYSGYLQIKIVSNYEYMTSKDILKKTFGADWATLLKQKTGFLESVVLNDIRQSSQLLRYLSSDILQVTSLSMYILIAFNISSFITSMTLALGLILFIAMKPFVIRKKRIAEKMAYVYKDIAHAINEGAIGAKAIKYSNIENAYIKKVSDIFYSFEKMRISGYMAVSIPSSFVQPIGLIFIVVVFVISYMTTDFTFVTFAAVVYLIQKMFVYIDSIQAGFTKMGTALPHLEILLDYSNKMDAKNEEMTKKITKGKVRWSFRNNIQFKNVSFVYENSDNNVLDNINFSISKGSMVGIIGRSGAGKTTIVDLILRLLSPTSGSILVDGVFLEDIELSEIRNNISYASQDLFLNNDSVKNNIKFYRENVSDKQITEAAKIAQCEDFINNLPNGYDTSVGERGVSLSVGQRQRIVIARALVRNPDILILDEVTSSLDKESENKIKETIESIRKKTTIIVIAHRISTLENCDELIVLDSGKVAECGKPQNLLKNKSSYFYKVSNI